MINQEEVQKQILEKNQKLSTKNAQKLNEDGSAIIKSLAKLSIDI